MKVKSIKYYSILFYSILFTLFNFNISFSQQYSNEQKALVQKKVEILFLIPEPYIYFINVH